MIKSQYQYYQPLRVLCLCAGWFFVWLPFYAMDEESEDAQSDIQCITDQDYEKLKRENLHEYLKGFQEATQDLKQAIRQAQDAQRQFEQYSRNIKTWEDFKRPLYNAAQGLTYIAVGYAIVSMHNEICDTSSYSPIHAFICNPLG